MAPPRARSRVACQRCQSRKVKCDLEQTSRPCTNCSRDGGACEVLPRKKHRPRRKRNSAGELVSNNEAATSPSTGRRHQLSQAQFSQSRLACSASLRAGTPSAEARFDSDVQIQAEIAANEVLEDPTFDPSHPDAPQQARAAMPTRLPALKPHEIEFLRQQGVFIQLPDDVCNELIQCYFQHIHFFLPILDAPAFLNEYCCHGTQGISPLLLWSLFLASANFADLQLLHRAGFSSRKAMKAAMYDRAKCLYDLDHGTDKLTLIRSVILLAFWYSDPQDHTGAWYWIGIAISLAQANNLHRSSGSSTRSKKSLPNNEFMARRIWWSLVVRDRWIAVAKGRPIRLRSDSHDQLMPAREDVLLELNQINDEARERFIPNHVSSLANLWLRMVRLSDTLGDVLQLHYRVTGPEPSQDEVNELLRQLNHQILGEMLPNCEDIIRVHSLQVEMLYQATIAILCRPYVLRATKPLSTGRNQQWEQTVVRRGREAAANTNNLLEQLIELNAVKYLKPMMITAMVPATQIHLADCKSGNKLTRGLGRNKLQLCMLVYAELRSTYWSADAMYRLFERAQALMPGHDTRPSSQGASLQPVTPEQELEQAADGSLEMGRQDNTLMSQGMTLPATDSIAPFLSGASPQFSDVDQLLSPGFALSEDMFLDFFPELPGRQLSSTVDY